MVALLLLFSVLRSRVCLPVDVPSIIYNSVCSAMQAARSSVAGSVWSIRNSPFAMDGIPFFTAC